MLIQANQEHHAVRKDGFLFHNQELAKLAKPAYTKDELHDLIDLLARHATTEPIYVTGKKVTLPEGEQPLLLMPATEPSSHHGDMSQMVYLRDQVQVAQSLLALHHADPIKYEKEGENGHALLLSALHLLSTPSQLARFDACISSYSRGILVKQSDWPQISLTYDNLDGQQPNGWRNIQDTIQMLAYATLKALETGQLTHKTLLESHKKFLGAIVPLITSAGFPYYENSGTWEEVTSERTSVMAVETALISTMFDLRLRKGSRSFAFLAHEYQGYRQKYPGVRRFTMAFDELLANLLQEGLTAIGARLPFESPSYGRKSVRYRTADMALIYLLRYEIPQLLVRYGIPVAMLEEPLAGSAREQQIESMILTHIHSLDDPNGYGMFRYMGDSYQRNNWGTHSTQKTVTAIKQFVKDEAKASGTGDIDLDLKQHLRGTLLPKGAQAAWSLGHVQIAAWAAHRATLHAKEKEEERAAHYRALGTKNLNTALSLITGNEQYTSAATSDGEYQVQPVTSWRLPECYVTYTDKNSSNTIPSAHTPLHWSAGLLKEATGLLHFSTLT